MASSILETNSASAECAVPSETRESVEFPALLYPVRKFSVAEYELMGQYDILNHDSRVELLDGWIVEKLTKYPPHTLVLEGLFWALHERLPSGLYVRNQEPITTLDSVPEPDLVVALGNRKSYGLRHPNVSEVKLVIEVSDSSLRRDRRKGVLYARAGLATYWIVNVLERCLEVYTEPISTEPARYQNRVILTVDETATIRFSDSVVISIPVSEFLSKS